MLKISAIDISLKITDLGWQRHLTGASELKTKLNIWQYMFNTLMSGEAYVHELA